nr:MAG TPA: Type III pantothenate kinase [Caudoviricetes sp.]DAU30718.1 MAG TPA: Type III pantothenate kinase [Bacteriophage sp.]
MQNVRYGRHGSAITIRIILYPGDWVGGIFLP